MSRAVEDKIDVVVTYVDGNDPVWLKEKSQYDGSDGNYQESDTEQRYRSIPYFNYWFRAIENYAPWVNKVFFVTYGHLPSWLDTSHPKLRIVKHEDYIPADYLPTYNSNVIELNLHRIPDLSEHFILFSDDVFLNAPVSLEDFFVGGRVKDYGIYAPLIPREEFNHIELNNTMVINKHFTKKMTFKKDPFKFLNLRYKKYIMNNLFAAFYRGIMGYKNFHVTLPHLKSTFEEVWNKEGKLLDKVCQNRFRGLNDVNHFLMSHWNIEANRFVPQRVNFGQYFPLHETNKVLKHLKNSPYKVLCINDEANNYDFASGFAKLEAAFAAKLPNKSSYER
ncbi:stealth family protein [Streptococcus dentapri]|uniref:Stealth family protein n=1 Tax=Streptococcus dentapri TaxID=573564 RepID=A0ABV8D0L1_9STRE